MCQEKKTRARNDDVKSKWEINKYEQYAHSFSVHNNQSLMLCPKHREYASVLQGLLLERP